MPSLSMNDIEMCSLLHYSGADVHIQLTDFSHIIEGEASEVTVAEQCLEYIHVPIINKNMFA